MQGHAAMQRPSVSQWGCGSESKVASRPDIRLHLGSATIDGGMRKAYAKAAVGAGWDVAGRRIGRPSRSHRASSSLTHRRDQDMTLRTATAAFLFAALAATGACAQESVDRKHNFAVETKRDFDSP